MRGLEENAEALRFDCKFRGLIGDVRRDEVVFVDQLSFSSRVTTALNFPYIC